MRISTLEEYGLRCAVHLARNAGNGAVSASSISKTEGISVEYVGKIMYLFRKAGFVRAERGSRGGFVFIESPSTLTVKRIFEALGTAVFRFSTEGFCHQFAAKHCAHEHQCSIRPVWSLLIDYFDTLLSQVTLSDLLGSEKETQMMLKKRLQNQNFLREVVQ